MKTLFKFIVMPIAAYVGIGWAADNPMKTKYLLNKVENKAESGYEFALFQFKSFTSEPSQDTKRNKKKKGQ